MKCKDADYLSHPIDNIYFLPGIIKIQAGSINLVRTCENLERARKLSDHLPVYMEFKIDEKDYILRYRIIQLERQFVWFRCL